MIVYDGSLSSAKVPEFLFFWWIVFRRFVKHEVVLDRERGRSRSRTTKTSSFSIENDQNEFVLDRERSRFRLTKRHISIKISQRMINIGIKIRPDVGIMFSAQCPICLIDLELSGTNIFSFFQVFCRFWSILEKKRFFSWPKLKKKWWHEKKNYFFKNYLIFVVRSPNMNSVLLASSEQSEFSQKSFFF